MPGLGLEVAAKHIARVHVLEGRDDARRVEARRRLVEPAHLVGLRPRVRIGASGGRGGGRRTAQEEAARLAHVCVQLAAEARLK